MSENNSPVQLTVTQILADLKAGLARPQIQAKYGLSAPDMILLFKNPNLKGKKASKQPGFVLVDDTIIEPIPTSQDDVPQGDAPQDESQSEVPQESEEGMY